jgi:hypothetical protein
MRLESVRSLKEELLAEIVAPLATRGAVRMAGARSAGLRVPGIDGEEASLFAVGARTLESVPDVHRSLALGVSPHGHQYRLAIRLQRAALRDSAIVEYLKRRARGEVDVRLVGRIDKRARARRIRSRRAAAVPAQVLPWYQRNTRPLLVGASVGHLRVTAGTIGAFVNRGGAICVLSNNHVLANENSAATGDWILQRALFDGGRRPAEEVAQLTQWVPLKRRGVNVVDVAVARIKAGVAHDPKLLRGLVNGRNRTFEGLGPESVDEGGYVYKIGRTTGPTRGRVTAFDLDNVIVNYDLGNLRFDGQIEIEGVGTKPFSDGGDSGALILNSRMEAVALLFAGSDAGGRNGAGLTFANPIRQALQQLRATLLS